MLRNEIECTNCKTVFEVKELVKDYFINNQKIKEFNCYLCPFCLDEVREV